MREGGTHERLRKLLQQKQKMSLAEKESTLTPTLSTPQHVVRESAQAKVERLNRTMIDGGYSLREVFALLSSENMYASSTLIDVEELLFVSRIELSEGASAMHGYAFPPSAKEANVALIVTSCRDARYPRYQYRLLNASTISAVISHQRHISTKERHAQLQELQSRSDIPGLEIWEQTKELIMSWVYVSRIPNDEGYYWVAKESGGPMIQFMPIDRSATVVAKTILSSLLIETDCEWIKLK